MVKLGIVGTVNLRLFILVSDRSDFFASFCKANLLSLNIASIARVVVRSHDASLYRIGC